MTKQERESQTRATIALMDNGITFDDVEALRRITKTLHSWYERECGMDNGYIERDETTGKPHWVDATTGARREMPDHEKRAEKKLKTIMAKYPHLTPHLQTDPRGGTLYILRPQDIIQNADINSYYNRGICVY